VDGVGVIEDTTILPVKSVEERTVEPSTTTITVVWLNVSTMSVDMSRAETLQGRQVAAEPLLVQCTVLPAVTSAEPR